MAQQDPVLRMRCPRALPVMGVCLLIALMAGCTQPPGDGEDEGTGPEADPVLISFYEELAGDRQAVMVTEHGEIRLHLYEALMPQTTGRFIGLAEDGFYDETTIHRNVERFVIQGGDPTGTGAGGSFETIPHERHDDLLFGHGALGLARGADEDSGDSQWFITITPQPHLSDPDSETAQTFGTYALYGQVTNGMDVVRAINQVPTIPGLDRPVDPPVVEQLRITDQDGGQDLLGLPRTISDRMTVGDHGLDVDRPLHVFAGHPFEPGVYLRPDDVESSAPQQVHVTYRLGEADPVLEERITLRPVDGDPWSFTGTALLQQQGEWEERVQIGQESTATGNVDVHAWHADYRAFAG